MSQSESYELQVVVTCGVDHVERAVLGFATALSAAAHDIPVVLVLAMLGARWAAESEGNEPLVPGYPPIAELIALIDDAGGVVQGCSSCVDQYCPAPVGEDGQKILRKGVTRVGLSVMTERMVDTSTVTF